MMLSNEPTLFCRFDHYWACGSPFWRPIKPCFCGVGQISTYVTIKNRSRCFLTLWYSWETVIYILHTKAIYILHKKVQNYNFKKGAQNAPPWSTVHLLHTSGSTCLEHQPWNAGSPGQSIVGTTKPPSWGQPSSRSPSFLLIHLQ